MKDNIATNKAVTGAIASDLLISMCTGGTNESAPVHRETSPRAKSNPMDITSCTTQAWVLREL